MRATIKRLPSIVWKGIEPNLRYFLSSRQPLVWLLANIIGLCVGVAAILFRLAIGLFQLPWLGTMSERVATAAAATPWYVILLAPAFGGLIVGIILQRFMSGDRPLAVADVIEARVLGGRRLTFRQGMWTTLVHSVSLGFGASAGREGPVVHLGAVLSESFCRLMRITGVPEKTLIACGVASAVSASFNAPIAGVLFAHEVILGHYAMSAFVPIVIASVVGGIVSRLYFGEVAAFTVPEYAINSYLEVPAFALLGLTCAAVAIIFQFALMGTEYTARSVKMPLWLRPVLGGLMVGAIGVFFPDILGVGYDTTDKALQGSLAISTLFALLFAKTAATAITLASRLGGGIFSPSLYLGAMTGGAFGLIAASVFPDIASGNGVYAIIGMGAVAAAVLGAPISTTVIVFELTGGYALTLALLFTVSIAVGITFAVHGRSWFHWQLETRGLFVSEGPHRYLIGTVRVRDFLEPLPPEKREEAEPFDPGGGEPYLRPADTLEAALRTFDSSGASTVPVVSPDDATKVIGHVSQIRALRYFNRALIRQSEEEHR
ncbi:chloride channel protein [Afifella pfennigii]|uniref:chloride channel protein n=1 Tax=Afifella pfennigii TaxID=209897 RepID=UPI00047978CE|nr:chloride channel protein [Afifella pfennigii]